MKILPWGQMDRHVEGNNSLMFIGPCIIAIVEERKTNLTSLVILFHLLCPQHVSDINISIFRSLRLCWWITTSVVLFSVRCVLEFLLRLIFGGVRFAGWSTSASANDIKLVFHSSTITMMHGPINIRSKCPLNASNSLPGYTISHHRRQKST